LQPSASDRLGAVGVYRCGESEVKFCWRAMEPPDQDIDLPSNEISPLALMPARTRRCGSRWSC
jgi:hypothetical protein